MVLLCLVGELCQAQIMYSTRYKSAIQLEGFGQSPIVSLNYEIAPIRYKRGFWTGRVGFGYMPGMQNPPPGLSGGSGFSVPVGVSYNMLLNNLKKDLVRRVMTRCKTMPPKVDLEWFLEAGGGYSLVIYPSDVNRNFLFTNIGLRSQLVINVPPKPRVIYARISLNPVYFDKQFTLLYRSPGGGYRFFGGFALGTSI